MFNLEHAIAQWRQQLLNAGLESPVPLDELESHLRDDIAAQTRSGLEAQQAFAAAVERVGRASALKAEFEKVGNVKKARELKLMGTILVGTACFYALFVGVFALFKIGSFSDFSFQEQMSASVASALTALLLVSGHLAHRFLPVIPNKRTRVGVYAAGLFLLFGWLGTFYQLVMTRFEFNVSQLVVAVLWALTPWGAILGCIYGLEHAALQKAAGNHS